MAAIQPIRHTPAQPSARVVDLTPEYAEELLGRNPRNRKISGRNLALISRAIANGEWEINGEAIKVAADGFILDGQHRCMAVVETGIAIKTFLIEGLPAATQDTMDTGKSRSLADILAIRGEASTNALASILRRIYISRSHGIKSAVTSAHIATNRECLAFFDENEWIRDLVQPARRVARDSHLPAAIAGFLWAAFAEIDADDAEFFFNRLSTGESLASDSPIYVLRKSLNTLADAKGERSQLYMTAIAIKAWNKFRDGEPIALLKFRPGGSNPEPFPEPH